MINLNLLLCLSSYESYRHRNTDGQKHKNYKKSSRCLRILFISATSNFYIYTTTI